MDHSSRTRSYGHFSERVSTRNSPMSSDDRFRRKLGVTFPSFRSRKTNEPDARSTAAWKFTPQGSSHPFHKDEVDGFGQADIEEQRAILAEIERENRRKAAGDQEPTRSGGGMYNATPEMTYQASFNENEIEEQRAILAEIERQRVKSMVGSKNSNLIFSRPLASGRPSLGSEQSTRCCDERSDTLAMMPRQGNSFVWRRPPQNDRDISREQIGLWRHEQNSAEDRNDSSFRPIVDPYEVDDLSRRGLFAASHSRLRWMERMSSRRQLAQSQRQTQSCQMEERHLVDFPHPPHARSKSATLELYDGQRVNIIYVRSDTSSCSQKRAVACVGCERKFAVSRQCQILFCPRCNTLTPLSILENRALERF